MRRYLIAFAAAIALFATPALAGNPLSVTIGTPGAGGGDPLFTAFGKINTAVNGLAQCFAGTVSPTFGGSPLNFECWIDTTGAPTSNIYKFWDGVSWVSAGTINATAHTFTPQGGATCGGADITGSFPNCTLVTSTNPNPGTFGDASHVPIITADNKGRITALSTANLSVAAPSAGSLTGTTLAANVVSSSLTSTGTLTSGALGAGYTVPLSTATITGTLACAREPALAGDVTTSAGSCSTSVGKIGGTSVGAPTGTAGTAVVLASSATLASPTINQSTENQPVVMGDTGAGAITAGAVGEVLTGTGTNVAVTTLVPTNIVTKSVTAGHWACSGGVATVPASGTTTQLFNTSISTTSATNGSPPALYQNQFVGAANTVEAASVGPLYLNFTSTTSVYLVADVQFGVSTMAVTGTLNCERIW